MNQDYAFGHAVADDFKKVITKVIPDAKIVGEDYAPIGQKDFGPYISKYWPAARISFSPEILVQT